jgi:TonB family protein
VKKASRPRHAPATLRTLVQIALILGAGFGFVAPSPLRAQAIVEDGSVVSGRKVLMRVQPEYPTLLKMTHIGGIVKLNASVLPDGSVIKVSVLGGNPILADEAVKAVRQWKFAAASGQTSEVIWFSFHAH